ncbi:AMP-binding enzyme [Massilia sp. PWRC2]|uniref:AMP-binding enzyme n=1 Tax=Massilia sp. PWRC2 TaxID=2804626 RepID=UPI003CEF26D6
MQKIAKTTGVDGAPLPRPWWHAAGSLRRFVADLVDGELGRLRPGAQHGPALATRPAATDLVADLGADSLELMALCAALTETLHLGHAAMLDGLLADTRLDSWVALTAAALDADADADVVAGNGQLTFRTSGSIGTPKPCVHDLANLLQEVAVLATLLPGRRRIVSAVPAHHIYGFLLTVLLAQQAAATDPSASSLVVCDVRAQLPAAVWQNARAGDLVIGYPQFWQAALAGAGAAPLAADVVGVSSTAPCADALATALLAAGLARLLQIYGSSETAGVGWRDAAAAPYQLLPFWQRSSQGEGEDADGAIVLRTLASGATQPYRLQDRLHWYDDGRFLPLARLDDAVQVGGINVFPAALATLLRQHPAVQDAAVRLMRADEGERLKAFIVVNEGSQGADPLLLHAQLDAWMRAQVAPAARPASYTFGAALPRQRNGKLADWIIDAGS